MRPEHLADLAVTSDAHLHPDGVRVAFVVTTMDLDEDVYRSRIWLWDGTEARQLTSGSSDASPRWSPDGMTLAFLRKGPSDDDRPQIAQLPISGGEASVSTTFDVGVSSFAWSPDGTRFVAQVAEYVDGMPDEEERSRAPRRIEHPSFRFDNQGWTYNRRSHLWIVDVASGETRKLTDGDCSEGGPAWSPDGSTIAFVSSTRPDRWIKPLGNVFTVPAEGGEPAVVSPGGAWDWVGYDPSGVLHVIGMETEEFRLEAAPLQRIEADGSLTRLTDLDRNLRPGHPPGELAGPRFLEDGTIHTLIEDRGMQRVIAIGSDGEVTDIAGGPRLITGWDPRPDGSAAVFTESTPVVPGEVAWWEGGEERRLTALNAEFIETADLVMPEEFTFESDGAEIHGWVLLPPGDGDVPVLLNIHGGPATQYGWGFFDEFQVYVGAGYGVVGVNPRGSSGYGDAYMQVPAGRWGEDVPPDQADLKRAPHAAAERFPRLDTSTMGIMGGSYGGVSTVMVTSMDQGYRSAVAERGVYNWVSMSGTSDIPWFIELYLHATMPEGAADIWQASPLSRAHRITTPTLVLHSETDYRCPVEQGQQLFTLLYQQGVETELLLFPPGEGHELSRSGKPKHRVERFHAILDWHARHLGGSPA
jgi:dipeptidyl aminopeptidase/acylaminoacyl peptidase